MVYRLLCWTGFCLFVPFLAMVMFGSGPAVGVAIFVCVSVMGLVELFRAIERDEL